MRTALFSRQQPGGVFDYVSIFNVQGDAWFVDSGHAAASDAVGFGQNPDAPCATWDYAVGLATASNGDVIFLMPGHAENLAGATSVAMDKAGIRVIGLGQGALRPTFTATAAAGCIAISAASCSIENIILTNTGTFNFSNGFTVTAADAAFKDVAIRDSAADSEFVVGILTDTNANRLVVDGLDYVGLVGGDAAASIIRLIGADDVRIRNSRFYGNWTTAGIEMKTTACLDVQVDNCYFYESGTTDFSLAVVNTGGTASTWHVRNCWDGAAAKEFSGGSGGALAGVDITTVSGGVSTNTSFLTVLSGSVKAVSQGVSTNASAITTVSAGVSSATSTLLVTSGGVSTNTSFLTILSGSVKTVSQGVSTNASIITTVSVGVSTNTSMLTTVSTGVSANTSIATTVSGGLSTLTSIVNALSGAISTILSKVTSGW
jgi:hypothetical protein